MCVCAYSGGILSALGLQDADSAYEFSEAGSPQSPALSADSAFSAFRGAPCLQASRPRKLTLRPTHSACTEPAEAMNAPLAFISPRNLHP